MEVLQGQTCTIGCNVWDLSATPPEPYSGAAVDLALQLNMPGNVDHGKYWDTAAGGHWVAHGSLAAPPAMTKVAEVAGWWVYDIPTAATTGKAGGTIVVASASDNLGAASPRQPVNTQTVDVVSTRRSPSGLRAVTLHYHTGAGVSVAGVTVAIYDNGLTNLLDRQVTDSGGNVVAYLDDGTYKIRCAKAGYTGITSTVVVTADATEVIVIAAIAAPAPASPAMCTVYGYVLDGAGVGIDDEQIDFYGYCPLGIDDTVLVTSPLSVVTGPAGNIAWPSGYFAIDLLREGMFRTSSRLAKLDGLVITVPDAANAYLATLIEDAKT